MLHRFSGFRSRAATFPPGTHAHHHDRWVVNGALRALGTPAEPSVGCCATSPAAGQSKHVTSTHNSPAPHRHVSPAAVTITHPYGNMIQSCVTSPNRYVTSVASRRRLLHHCALCSFLPLFPPHPHGNCTPLGHARTLWGARLCLTVLQGHQHPRSPEQTRWQCRAPCQIRSSCPGDAWRPIL